jgi:hypothetical protein
MINATQQVQKLFQFIDPSADVATIKAVFDAGFTVETFKEFKDLGIFSVDEVAILLGVIPEDDPESDSEDVSGDARDGWEVADAAVDFL